MNKILLTAAVLMLGACGFHLKGQSGALHTPAYKNWHIEGGQALQFPLETALHQVSVRVTDTGGAQQYFPAQGDLHHHPCGGD